MNAAVWAATRDASWYNKPGVAMQYHVVMEGAGWYAACSPPKPGQGLPRMLLVDFTVVDAAEVTEIARCKRPGCRQRWPEPASSVSRGTVTG